MAKGGSPERKSSVVATVSSPGHRSCAVHRCPQAARHMAATAGEQGGHAGLMRPFESLNSGTKARVLRQAEQYLSSGLN